MLTQPTETDLQWSAGVLDVYGSVEIVGHSNSPYMLVRFKTPYLDRVIEFQKAVGGLGKIRGPIAPSGHSVQPQYQLVFSGSDCAILENMLVPRMRTKKRNQFARRREELREIRDRRGIRGPFRIPKDEDVAA